jgi:hypothetical protein
LANTGANHTNHNVFGGSIRSGNISVSNYQSVKANSNWTYIRL